MYTKRTTLIIILIATTTAFIIFNSCQNAAASWELSNATGSIFAPILHALHNAVFALFGWTGNTVITDYGAFVRKLAHFLEYAALGAEYAALSFTLKKDTNTSFVWMALFFPLITAVADEFVQGFFGRSSLVSDVLLDFAGACCGIAITICILYVVARIKESRKYNNQ